MQLAGTTPTAAAPKRGDWPFTIAPPTGLGETAYADLLRAVPDRTGPATSIAVVGTPDDAAKWVAYSLGRTAEAGAAMQAGIDHDPEAFRSAVHGAADYARLANRGLSAWLRSDPFKVAVLERFDAATRTLADIGTRWTYDVQLRERIGQYNLARLVIDASSATRDVLALLAEPDAVRQRPQL